MIPVRFLMEEGHYIFDSQKSIPIYIHHFKPEPNTRPFHSILSMIDSMIDYIEKDIEHHICLIV